MCQIQDGAQVNQEVIWDQVGGWGSLLELEELKTNINFPCLWSESIEKDKLQDFPAPRNVHTSFKFKLVQNQISLPFPSSMPHRTCLNTKRTKTKGDKYKQCLF